MWVVLEHKLDLAPLMVGLNMFWIRLGVGVSDFVVYMSELIVNIMIGMHYYAWFRQIHAVLLKTHKRVRRCPVGATNQSRLRSSMY